MALLTSILMLIGLINNPSVNQSTTSTGSATELNTHTANGGGWDWTNHQVK